MSKLENILNCYDDVEFMVADGFDDAIIGVDDAIIGVDDNHTRIAYSINKCIDILVNRDGMKYDEALEYFNFNVSSAYVGENTPIWINDLF